MDVRNPGAGILYVKPDLIADCQPEIRGWFSQDNPFNWGLDTFELADDIRRFDNGTPSIVSALSSVPALRWHAGLNLNELLEHNRKLSNKILEVVDQSSMELVSPRDDHRRGGSIMLKFKDEMSARSFLEQMRKIELFADCRDSILRLSPGIMTSEDATNDLSKLIEQSN